jgi:hypothetical protein
VLLENSYKGEDVVKRYYKQKISLAKITLVKGEFNDDLYY